MEVGPRRRVQAAPERHAALRLPRPRDADFYHDVHYFM